MQSFLTTSINFDTSISVVEKLLSLRESFWYKCLDSNRKSTITPYDFLNISEEIKFLEQPG